MNQGKSLKILLFQPKVGLWKGLEMDQWENLGKFLELSPKWIQCFSFPLSPFPLPPSPSSQVAIKNLSIQIQPPELAQELSCFGAGGEGSGLDVLAEGGCGFKGIGHATTHLC